MKLPKAGVCAAPAGTRASGVLRPLTDMPVSVPVRAWTRAG